MGGLVNTVGSELIEVIQDIQVNLIPQQKTTPEVASTSNRSLPLQLWEYLDDNLFLLSFFSTLTVSAMELLDTFITGHLFKFLNCPYDDVSLSVFRLTTSYLNLIVFKSLNTTTNPPSLPPKYLEHIQIFLNIIRNKLKYMDDFDFNSKDEEEAQFLEYRKELRGIFKIITKISPQVNILSISI